MSDCSAIPRDQLMGILDLKHYRCNRVGGVKNYSKCIAFCPRIIARLIKPLAVRRVGRSCELMTPKSQDTMLIPLLILVLEVIYRHFAESFTTSSTSPRSSTASEPEMKKVKPCSGFCTRIPTFDRPPVVCYRRLYFCGLQV